MTETFKIRNRLSGAMQVIVEIESDADDSFSLKLGLAVKAAIKAGANLAGADLTGADLANANLANANLADTDFTGADLAGANLTDAYLMGASLAGANLTDAGLARANLVGATLADANAIDAGQDRRGWRFIATIYNGVTSVWAGCRGPLTIAEAQEWWSERHDDDPSLRAECLAKVDLLEAVARARGWPIEKQE